MGAPQVRANLLGLLLFAGGLFVGIFIGGGDCVDSNEISIGEHSQQVISPATKENPVASTHQAISEIKTPAPRIERIEAAEIEYHFSERVIAVAQGLRNPYSASWYEAYHLAHDVLEAPWADIRRTNDDRFFRINAEAGDQEVRFAARGRDLFLIFPLTKDFSSPYARNFNLQIHVIRNGEEDLDSFDMFRVSLYYEADWTEEAEDWFAGQKNLKFFPGYEVTVYSEDSYTKKENPDWLDHSSLAVWGIGLNGGSHSTIEFPDLAREGSVVDRVLCASVHTKLYFLARAIKRGEWPLEDPEFLPHH